MNILEQLYGKPVRTDNDELCVVVGQKGDKLRLLTESGSFKYESGNSIDDKPLDANSKLGLSFARFEKLQSLMLSEELQKARPGLVQKKITVQGRTGAYQKNVWVRVESETGGKEKRVGQSNKWFERLKPSQDEFAKIQGKDVNSLVNYVQDRFWRGAQVKEQVIKTAGGRKQVANVKVTGSYTEPGTLAYAFVKSNVDGYEIDDLIQESTIKLMELQEKGSMNNVSLDKFPSYVATIFANVGRNMSRTNRNKSMGDAIDTFVEQIKSKETPTETQSKENLDIVKHKVDDIYSAVIKEIKSNKSSSFKDRGVTIFNKYLEGKKSKDIAKELGTNDNTIKQVLKRLNVYVDRIADNMGVKTDNPAKTFRNAFKQLNSTPSLTKSFTLTPNGSGGFIARKVPEARPVTEEIEFDDICVTIENPTGSIRSGDDWWTFMDYPYGYIQNTVGMDGEEVDCFLGPNFQSKNVYIVTIKDPFTKEIDEEKVFFGFNNESEVLEVFYNHYDDDDFFDSIEYMSLDAFKENYLLDDLDFDQSRKELDKEPRLYKAEGTGTGRGLPVGETTTRKDGTTWRKDGPGKWTQVPGEKGKGKKEKEKKEKGNKDTGSNPMAQLSDKSKKAVVIAVKGLTEVISNALRGDKTEDVGADASSTIEQEAQNINDKSKPNSEPKPKTEKEKKEKSKDKKPKDETEDKK